MREHTINIPRYPISLTHERTALADGDTDRHEALFRGPVRKQHDFRVDYHYQAYQAETCTFWLKGQGHKLKVLLAE